MPAAAKCLIAVDVGNCRIKLGAFDRPGEGNLPAPKGVFDLPITNGRGGAFDSARLESWCAEHVADGDLWHVASVHEAAADRLTDAVANWSRRSRLRCPIRRVTYRDVRLPILVEEPSRVGVDRLLGALAADRQRHRGRAAIVVDLGTAITVDLLTADGEFAGGAILPGIGLAAKALGDNTAALPHIDMERAGKPPIVPGRSTTAAIEAGLFWGAVGSIRELVSQLASGLDAPPELFLTGGGAWHVADVLRKTEGSVRHEPHLVLTGIALVADAGC